MESRFDKKKFERARMSLGKSPVKKETPVYKSGMKNGQPIDFMNPKMKRGIITSLD